MQRSDFAGAQSGLRICCSHTTKTAYFKTLFFSIILYYSVYKRAVSHESHLNVPAYQLSFAFAQLRCGTTPRVLDETFLLPFCATDVQAGWSIFLPNLDQNKIYVCFLFGCLFVCLDATSLVILIKALLKSEEFGRIRG